VEGDRKADVIVHGAEARHAQGADRLEYHRCNPVLPRSRGVHPTPDRLVSLGTDRSGSGGFHVVSAIVHIARRERQLHSKVEVSISFARCTGWLQKQSGPYLPHAVHSVHHLIAALHCESVTRRRYWMVDYQRDVSFSIDLTPGCG
jgi:hypothetical protein